MPVRIPPAMMGAPIATVSLKAAPGRPVPMVELKVLDGTGAFVGEFAVTEVWALIAGLWQVLHEGAPPAYAGRGRRG